MTGYSWIRIRSTATCWARHLDKRNTNNHPFVGFRRVSECRPATKLCSSDPQSSEEDWRDVLRRRCLFSDLEECRKYNVRNGIVCLDDRRFFRPASCTSDDIFLWQAAPLHSKETLDRYKKNAFFCSESDKMSTGGADNRKNEDSSSGGKASYEQLENVFNQLPENLEKFFVKSMNYQMYHRDIVFINNIRGMRTVGITNYIKQAALLRTVGHLKYAYVKLDVLRITKRPEDSAVIVRWRIRGISGWKVLFMFWKFNLLDMKNAIMKEQENWYDGLSTFYVGSDGLIHTHVADKMMPDEDSVVDKAIKSPLAAKLALFVGLLPRSEIFMSKKTSDRLAKVLN